MANEQANIERRSGHRFDFQVPISLTRTSTGEVFTGVTQNISSRGVLLFCDFELTPGEAVEFAMLMPSEVTMTETMRVRCSGKVLRVLPSIVADRFGIAIRLENYEFLPDAETDSISADSVSHSSQELS